MPAVASFWQRELLQLGIHLAGYQVNLVHVHLLHTNGYLILKQNKQNNSTGWKRRKEQVLYFLKNYTSVLNVAGHATNSI